MIDLNKQLKKKETVAAKKFGKLLKFNSNNVGLYSHTFPLQTQERE